jgi:hypothetical protein
MPHSAVECNLLCVIDYLWGTTWGYTEASHFRSECLSIYLQSFFGPWPLFQFFILYTVRRTPWTGVQPFARPLPTHRITQTDIYALSGIRTHDAIVRASEDISSFRPLGHCDRLVLNMNSRNKILEVRTFPHVPVAAGSEYTQKK